MFAPAPSLQPDLRREARSEWPRGRWPWVRLRTVNESGILWRVTADHMAVCAEIPAIQLMNRTTVLRISQQRCCAVDGTARASSAPRQEEASS